MIDAQIQQLLRERYNPEGSPCRELQLQLLEILKEFDAICTRHQIPYWIDSGTLIGAVRHGGFIPWDDDIDVCVLKRDQARLREVMLRELRAPMQYVDNKVDAAHARKWPRIIKSGVATDSHGNHHQGIWLDVFIMEYGNRRLFNLVNQTYGRCYRRQSGLIVESPLRRLLVSIAYPLCWLIMQSARCWGRCFCRNTLIFDYGGIFSSIRKMDEIFPLTRIEFEGMNFSAPVHSDRYLRRIYGDYMALPAECLRTTHNLV